MGVLESRLESMYPGDDPNGYIFYISEEQKRTDMILDDKTKLKNAIHHINSLIRFKSESRDKSLILEITDSQHDYRSILSELIQNYLNLGFIVEEIEIMGEKYLFISWKDKI